MDPLPHSSGPLRFHPRTVSTETTLTCPSCASEQRATIPTDACQFFFTCAACGQRLRPKPGDCCVFCSYATDT